MLAVAAARLALAKLQARLHQEGAVVVVAPEWKAALRQPKSAHQKL
jgi:hypothetical protein